MLISEETTNRVVESGERVTVSLALKNVGDEPASNLVATIQSGNGVLNPAPEQQDYGILLPWAPSVAREFAFTANAPINSLLLVELDLTHSGGDLGTVTFRFRIGPQGSFATNAQTIVVNPAGRATPYPSILSVTNAVGSIHSVSLTLSNLHHEFPDDLDILLVSPSGDAVMIMSDACGVVPMTDTTITFADNAGQPLPDFALPILPRYRPTNYGDDDTFPPPAPMRPYAGVMSAFNGKIANGDWKLYIFDDIDPDELGGAIDSGWVLTITTMQSVDAVPTLTSLGRTNNMIRIAVSGRPGYSYALEDSPDPVQSSPLETFIMPAQGIRIFEYPIGPINRFFRAATDP